LKQLEEMEELKRQETARKAAEAQQQLEQQALQAKLAELQAQQAQQQQQQQFQQQQQQQQVTQQTVNSGASVDVSGLLSRINQLEQVLKTQQDVILQYTKLASESVQTLLTQGATKRDLTGLATKVDLGTINTGSGDSQAVVREVQAIKYVLHTQSDLVFLIPKGNVV
jgi:PPE-repeat protein